MHDRAAEFVDRAHDRYDVALEVREFDAGTETAAAAAEAVGCEPGAIASTIVVSLGDDDTPTEATTGSHASAENDLVAAVTSRSNRHDPDAVARPCGVPAEAMGAPDRTRAVVWWCTVGGPPCCHATTVPTVMDASRGAFDRVCGAVGTPSALFSIAPDRLADLADATVVDLTE